MRARPAVETTTPQLVDKALELRDYVTSLSVAQLMSSMQVSAKLAGDVQQMFADWSTESTLQTPAARAFLGDIYSGLQVAGWTEDDWGYAQTSLRILSGLYGVLRPRDGVMPYRLEMGYRLPDLPKIPATSDSLAERSSPVSSFEAPTGAPLSDNRTRSFPLDNSEAGEVLRKSGLPDESFANLYKFWGQDIADALPETDWIIDLTAVEYGKTVTKYLPKERFIAPKFMTVSPKTGQPTFVTVHAKIARGAFANWLIKERVESVGKLRDFRKLGYVFDAALSTPQVPVYVCEKFDGLGLSVRLT